jgi:hypothetical protein
MTRVLILAGLVAWPFATLWLLERLHRRLLPPAPRPAATVVRLDRYRRVRSLRSAA